MSGPKKAELLVNAGWHDVLAWLAVDLDALAFETGAMQRRRVVRSGELLLRMVLLYSAVGLSLRGTAAWLANAGIAQMSDVAVLKRLVKAPPFLRTLLGRLLAQSVKAAGALGVQRRVKLVDATTVSSPGAKGAEWRIHVAWDATTRRPSDVVVTDARGGEHLGRFTFGPGDLVVADRGYAHAHRIIDVARSGAEVAVRIGHRSVVLLDPKTLERLDPVDVARRRRPHPGRPPVVEEVDVVLRDRHGRTLPARLLIVRKSAAVVERERRRVSREARRDGRTPSRRTLDAAAFTFLLGTVPKEAASARELAELYRIRWQVERTFRRWKSLLGLDELRAHQPELAETFLLGKLVAGALAEMVCFTATAFSPWGLPLHEARSEHRQDLPLGDARRPHRRSRRRPSRRPVASPDRTHPPQPPA